MHKLRWSRALASNCPAGPVQRSKEHAVRRSGKPLQSRGGFYIYRLSATDMSVFTDGKRERAVTDEHVGIKQ